MSKGKNISPQPKGSTSKSIDFAGLKEMTSSQVLGLIVFIGLLAIPYIYNSHLSDKKHRQSVKVKSELKELRAEYITLKSEIVGQNKQSDVSKRLINKGLKPISEAPTDLNIEGD
ncbi:MAG: hypothetical protein ACI9JN_000452 [Bacteroidia bacterium]|jgi:hypothetical protein